MTQMNADYHHIHGDRFLKLADVILRRKERTDYYKVTDWNGENTMYLEEIPTKWNNPKLLFMNTEDILFFKDHLYKIQNPFVLLSHNADTNITDEFSFLYEHPKLVHWFTQNLCIQHSKISFLPIGFANPIWQHGDYKLLDAIKQMQLQKQVGIYANFLIETNRTKREECLRILQEKGIPIFPRTPPHIYLQELASSLFCICPEGNGVDTHRFWEALHMKSLPIVLRNSFTEFLSRDFPCILLDSWQQLSPAFLEQATVRQKLQWLFTNNPNFETKLSFSHYHNLIELQRNKDSLLTINLWDEEFRHVASQVGYDTCSYKLKPTKIQYSRDNYEWDGISVFTNRALEKVKEVKSPIKVAWMMEARSILPETFRKLQELEDNFDYILTWYHNLLESNPKKYKCIVTGSTRIMEADRKIYTKSKLCSLLVSKQKTTEAHRFRHQLANMLQYSSIKEDITIFGGNFTPFETKLEAHRDFMFSIVITNSCENSYFTEYIIDCFMCGTIPVFYGAPNIGEYFNIDGILHFTKLEDIFSLLPKITSEYYNSKLDAIKDNFERAKKYASTDDMLADILKNLK